MSWLCATCLSLTGHACQALVAVVLSVSKVLTSAMMNLGCASNKCIANLNTYVIIRIVILLHIAIAAILAVASVAMYGSFLSMHVCVHIHSLLLHGLHCRLLGLHGAGLHGLLHGGLHGQSHCGKAGDLRNCKAGWNQNRLGDTHRY